jgi:hypothetical protein
MMLDGLKEQDGSWFMVEVSLLRLDSCCMMLLCGYKRRGMNVYAWMGKKRMFTRS